MAGIPPEPYLWTQVIYNSVLLIGIPGNLIIIKVYHSKSPRCSAHIFIIGLALADLFVSLLRPLSIVMNLPAYAHLQHSSQAFCIAPRFINLVSMYSSVFLTSAVAFDRYFCVCRPHERKMTPFRAKIIVLMALILSLFVSLPNVFAFGLVTLPYGPGTVCKRISSAWLTTLQQGLLLISFVSASVIVVVLYRKVFQAIKKQRLRLRSFVQPTQSVLPTEIVAEMQDTTVVTVSSRSQVQPISNSPQRRPREAFVDPRPPVPSANAGATVTLTNQATVTSNNRVTFHVDNNEETGNNHLEQQRQAKREKAAAAYSVQGRTSKMLLLTTAVFIITWIPPLLFGLIPRDNNNQQNPALTYTIQGLFSIVLINHAINPLIYGFVNKRFRNDCIKVLKNIKWPWKRY